MASVRHGLGFFLRTSRRLPYGAGYGQKLAEQERDIGRDRYSGYPLEGPRGDITFAYGQGPDYDHPEAKYNVGYRSRLYEVEHYERPQTEYQRARFVRSLAVMGTFAGAFSQVRAMVGILMWTWQENKVQSMQGNIEIDISDIPTGTVKTVIWRGKPVFLYHRNPAQIAAARAVPLASMKEPATDEARTPLSPEWLIVMASCTHLGCIPVHHHGDFGPDGGFLCPCHGSHYDSAARIHKGPAPKNLELAPAKMLSDTLLYLGD
jgi:ubiquinol-cytochrome c reductase iron-sulfur subunit